MKIAVSEIEFLGAIIGNCRIKLQPHVISKIADFKNNELKTTKGMRSWLGLLNYARNYIPNLGKLLGPLYAKTSPNGEKKLNQQDWDLIQQIKEKVKQLPDLEIPPSECYIILEVDGCMDGWGDQIRNYRRNQRRLYNTQQAARRIGRQLTGGGTTRYTLEQQLELEAQLQLSMQERASIVPAEVLYHSRRDDAHHRVYVHRLEEAILVTDNHQVDRNFIQEESFAHLQRSRMQYIHLGVLQVRIQILHRQYEGTMALVVFRDNRWQGDQAILATMEVDLTRGSQMIYVIPEVMMTIGDFYRNIQISILTKGYEAWQNSEANLLITREIPPIGWDDEVGETNNAQKEESIAASERYSSTTEPYILINKITPNAVTPSRQSEGSAGLDISASHLAVIEPYGRDLIHTGLRIEIPYGYYGRLTSRSVLAWKTGIEVGAGVIDSDYREEVQVLLFNRTNLPIYISQQQKVAQLILEKIAIPEVYEVPHLSHTERGNKGFGSTEAQNQITLIPEKEQALTSQDPRYFTSQDIFALLMPKETTAVLVQDDSFLSNFEQDHAVDTSLGVVVPRGQQPPQWDNSPDSEDNWINSFASEGGGRQEAFIQLNPQECNKFIELVAANVEMEYPCLSRLVEEVSPATEQIYSTSTVISPYRPPKNRRVAKWKRKLGN
ncbi:hypothetical protein ZIOFF_031632 [Zingiber officinale]|uniref:dUTP diphosphatase n=1 Tax=Zingiber officinale TaxID=94328 RepID=A0A8J5GEK0_ZINOF|nr:hypothetical protein ZIOFF_031632 [Zingiber officinale]